MSVVNTLQKLPEIVFTTLPGSRQVIAIRRGVMGYYPINTNHSPEQLNNGRVTDDQIEAMLAGSAFGWDVPAADPDFIREMRERKEKAA